MGNDVKGVHVGQGVEVGDADGQVQVDDDDDGLASRDVIAQEYIYIKSIYLNLTQ